MIFTYGLAVVGCLPQDYCPEEYKWKGDDFQVMSGDDYVITPEGDVILKETGDLL